MTPLELKARRESLGLNQEQLARLLHVKQATLSLWESGSREPRDPVSVSMILDQIEDLHDQVIDELCEQAEHASAVRNTPNVQIRTYQSDEDYWEADARARELRIPACLHRSAAAWARRILASEQSIIAEIVG